MTELQYLQEQSRQAKASTGAAVMEIKKDAARAVDPRPFMRKHPWMCVGIALALGFAATAFICRRCKDKSETPASPPVEEEKPARPRDLRKWFGRAKLIVSLVKPLIEGILAVQAAASENNQEPPVPASGHEA
jgi:hypothetical protein